MKALRVILNILTSVRRRWIALISVLKGGEPMSLLSRKSLG